MDVESTVGISVLYVYWTLLVTKGTNTTVTSTTDHFSSHLFLIHLTTTLTESTVNM